MFVENDLVRTRPKESTALAFPRRYSRMGINGDGSTLSLDFTAMSSLDSRFTFSRTSNATYINSSGYVAYADSNMAINTAWLDTNTTPTGWTVYNATTPNAVLTIPSSGRRSMTVTSGVQSFLYQVITIPAGFTHTASIIVHSVTGTGPQLGSLFAINNGTISTFYKDGSSTGITSSTIVTAGTYAITFTGGDQIRLVGGSGVAASTFTIEISSLQIQIGTTISPAFIPNTSTSVAYYAPRFDYNPTTLAAKGLLIEGSTINSALYSESFVTSAGIYNDNAILNRTTTETSPSGGTAICFFPTTVLDYHRLQYSSVPVLSGVMTISIWLKRKDSNYRGGINAGNYLGASAVFDLNGAGSVVTLGGTATNKAATITAYPNNWYRVSLTGTYVAGNSFYIFMTSSTSTDSTGENFTGVASQGLIMWGIQIELGTGASSYIPTVASQVTRAQELCTLPITPASIGLTTSLIGTCFYEATVNCLPTSGYPLIVGFTDIGNNSKAWLSQVSTTGSNYSSWKTSTGTVGDVTFTNVVIPKTSFKFASSISSTQNLASRNGTAGTAGAVSSAVLSVPTQLNFGGVIDSMIIAKFKFFPTTKSQAELNALST